jgi:solute:Na+ symporter, SSS family
MNAALVGIAAAVVLALGLGFLAGRGRQMNLEQWTVAGQAFGAPLVFLLMAGETTRPSPFWAVAASPTARVARSNILCYGSLAYVISYFMLPAI